MLTDERILEVAVEYEENADYWDTEISFQKSKLIDFARKILAEVKLQDIINKEGDFIQSNTDSFNRYFTNIYDVELYDIRFNTTHIFIEFVGENAEHIRTDFLLEEYYNWKQQLTEQAQEVKR